MLETVLAIGKAFRDSPDGLKHHRYIKPCPEDTDKRNIFRLSLPVRDDFSFDFAGLNKISDENIIRKLYYLTFKTSGADALVKYVFGDIYYTIQSGKEGGYYRLGDPSNKQKAFRMNSFQRGEEDFQDIANLYEEQLRENGLSTVDSKRFSINRFHESFKKHYALIERLLRYQSGIAEYFEQSKKGYMQDTISEILSNEEKLKVLSAQRIFSEIKQSRTASKSWRRLQFDEEPDWDVIQHSREAINKLNGEAVRELFLHFDFGGKHWYEFTDDLYFLNQKMLADFAEEMNKPEGIVLKKYVYKTLSSAEKDVQFPTFRPEARYRSRIFKNLSEIEDLVYAIDYSQTALIKIRYSDIKIIVLPKGKNLTAADFEKFSHRDSATQIQEHEEEISRSNEAESDQLFAPLTQDVAENIIQYDLIFSKQGGMSSPDVDLIELAGIEKSHLQEIDKRIRKIKNKLYDQRKEEIKGELRPLSLTWSFFNLLSVTLKNIDPSKPPKQQPKPLYQRHLYKVLPQIYTGTYFQDTVLFPAFIEKTESNVRNELLNFNFLKYDFYFLTKIQNTKLEGANLMRIQESPSYQVGLLLGKLARPLRKPIKSFEKSYVGNLSRRISTLTDLIRFKTFIEEKLVIHEKTYPNIREASMQLAEVLREFSERYDKHECAFGFFESYFAPIPSNEQDADTTETTEEHEDYN